MVFRLRRAIGNEIGATAVLIAIVLVVLIGSAALAIDAGSLWSTRRSLITDTDAAALAAARALVKKPCAVGAAEQEARDVLKTNNVGSRMIEFKITFWNGVCASKAGKVQVTGEQDPQLAFGPVLGADPADSAVVAASIAHYGALISAPGLWPIALCEQNSHVGEWIEANEGPTAMANYQSLKGTDNLLTPYFDHPAYSAAGVTHRVLFTRQYDELPLIGACKKSPGNWGWVDYDGNPGGGAQQVGERLLNGYEGTVDLGGRNRNDEDCEPDSEGLEWCQAQTGSIAATKNQLDVVVCPGDTPAEKCQYQYPIIFYSETNEGRGNNLRYHHVGFTGVVIRDYEKVTGVGPSQEKCLELDANQCPHFDFEFTSLIWEGAVGPPPAPDASPLLGAQLCGVEYSGELNDNCFF